MATEDVNISIGADSSKAISELNKIQQKFNELAAAANTPIGIAINSKAAKKEFEDLTKAFEQYRTQLYKDKRPPSKGGLAEDAFFGVYGFKKGQADSAVNEFAGILKNSATNQINQASIVEDQVSAIARRSNSEQKYLATLRTNSDKKNAADFTKVWNAAHDEYNQREQQMVNAAQAANKARTEAFNKESLAQSKAASAAIRSQFEERFKKEDELTKGAQLANKHRTEAADKAAQAESKAFSSAIKKQMEERVAQENYLAKLRVNSSKVNQEQINKDHAAAIKEFADIQKAAKGADLSMPSLRYALYDIASSAQQFSQSVAIAGTAVIKFASDYETAATNIQRTTLAPEAQLQAINRELISLSEQIPVSFVDLAGIATMGAQLGIEATNLAGFSKTVAEFSAATNVSTDSAAQSFGALGELLNISASEYQNLGSSIAYVGVNSVATETQIISVAEAIGGVANSAGLSADYVIGLSGALASLKIPAEQSRGALTRIFSEINRAAAGTGVDIQLFANVLGVTADEAKRLAQSDMQTFFTKFVNGLSGIDSTQFTTVLDQLNLADIRVTNTLTRLSRNTDLVAETLNNANSSFEEGSFLSEVYALRVDDLASKLQILQNSLANLGANVGATFEPIVKLVVDGITQIVQGLNQALSTEAGKTFTYLAGGAIALAGIIATLIQGFAMFIASLGAVRFALKILGWESATGGFKALAVGLFGAKSAADATSASMGRLKFALASTGIGLAITLLGTLAAAFMEAGRSADIAFQSYVGDTSGLADALAADRQALTDALNAGNYAAAKGYTVVTSAIGDNNAAQDEAIAKYQAAADFLNSDIPNALSSANGAIETNTQILGENTFAWLKNRLMQSEDFQNLISDSGFVDAWQNIGIDFQKAASIAALGGEAAVRDYFMAQAMAAVQSGSLAAEVVRRQQESINLGLAPIPLGTLQKQVASDYVNSKSFQQMSSMLSGFGSKVRFIGGSIDSQGKSATNAASANEDYAGSIDSVGGSAGGAAEKVRTLTDYANDLSSVWERARDIRFSGAETIDKVTSSFQKIAKATADAREEIDQLQADSQELQADQALQQYFLSVAEAYGDTLKAQEIRANLAKIDTDLTKKTKDLQKAQDKTNKTLVGNSEAAIDNRSEILGLVQGYQNHIKALAASGVKEDELRAKTAQLKQDFIAQATQIGYNVDELGLYAVAFDDVGAAINAIPRDVTVDFNGDPALTAIQEFAAKSRSAIAGAGGSVPITADTSDFLAAQELIKRYMQLSTQWAAIPASEREGRNAIMQQMLSINTRLKNHDYATGGYVSGPGGPTSDSIHARLSNGEYVVRAAAVSKYGVGFFDRLNQMQSPRFASGGYVAPASTGMVSLSPEDRALLRNIGGTGEVVLYANNEALARSVNAGNKSIVAQGGRP